MTSAPLPPALPLGTARSDCYRLWLGEHPLEVARARLSDYAILPAGHTEVVVETAIPIAPEDVTLRPAAAAIAPRVAGNRIRIACDGPRQLHLEVAGLPDLLLVVHAWPEPPAADAEVIRFGPGLHRHGIIRVASGQTVWLDAGAVVQGRILAEDAEDAEDITVGGAGVLDGSPHRKGEHSETNHMMHFRHCRGVRVSGVTVVDSSGWNIVPNCCDDVVIERVQILGPNVTSDGIDVCASRQVRIADCYLRCNDDCVVIKGPKGVEDRAAERGWPTAVRDVTVERCICYNERAGNVFEIGFETACERIGDVVFRDCDVLAGHGQGGVFTIHAGDRALIEGIVYEDIRVEHFYERLIDFTVLDSRYSRDAERGRIRDITLRRIRTCADPFNTPSLIGGWDAEHDVRGVHLEDVYIGERHVDSLDALHAFTRNASDITFA